MAQLQIPLDADRFAKGLKWKDFVAQMGETQAKTEHNYEKSKLADEERRFFGGITQVKYAMMLAENWCPDVHRGAPLIAHVCEAMQGCDLRVFFRDQNPDLRDALLNNGYQSIPTVVFFDKDWNEIGRWIERSHAATIVLTNIRAKTGDNPTEYRRQFQIEYDAPGGPLWRAAASEIRLLLEQRLGLLGKK